MTFSNSSRIALFAVALAMAGLVACGEDSGSGGSSSGGSGSNSSSNGGTGTGQTVVIRDFKYEPANLKVAPGAKVTVKNEDAAPHTLTADDRSFDTGNIEGKGQKEITAGKAGSISYKCDIHQYMTGVIQVGGP